MKKGSWMCLQTHSNNFKIWKRLYRKKNLGVGVVVDYTDIRFSNFEIEYLRENKQVRATVFACSHGAQSKYFKPKNGR